MRTSESLPVFQSQGKVFDPPDAGTTSRAKRVTRLYYCKFTGVTKKVERQISVYHDKATNTDTIRTTLVSRTPPRPLSTGFHTKKEKREEAIERDTAWRSLSVKDQLSALDKRLGVGVGAQKQRARLESILKNPPKAKESKAPEKSLVNQKQTPEEKAAKQMAHTQGMINVRRRPKTV